MKNQEGFIQISILIAIIAGILIVGSGGYYTFKKYDSFKMARVEQKRLTEESEKSRQDKEKQTQDLIIAQQETLEKTKKELDEARSESKSAVNAAQKVNEKIIKLEQRINEPVEKPKDLSSVIKSWRPRVVRVVCNWRYKTGEHYLTASGSGFVFFDSFPESSGVWALTNRHVIFDEGKYGPYLCTIKLPDESKVFETPFSQLSYRTWSPLDMALIELKNPTDYVKNLVASNALSSFCKFTPAIGDQIAILGYPGIGTVNDITATEGIISGFDGDYYTTSAKIEHGNSGGIAVSIAKDCILGIPTFVKVGELETLGRILSSKTMLNRWGISF